MESWDRHNTIPRLSTIILVDPKIGHHTNNNNNHRYMYRILENFRKGEGGSIALCHKAIHV